MGSKIHKPYLDLPVGFIASVNQGGLGGVTKEASLQNINALPLSELVANNPNGAILLGADGKLTDFTMDSKSFVVPANLNGPTEAPINSQINYEITNYNEFSTYTVSVNKGSFIRTKGNIVIQTPNELGTMELTINNRKIIIQLYALRSIPTLSVSKLNSIFTLTGSAFVPSIADDTHVETHWEISRDSNFTDIILRDYNNTEKLTSYTYRSNVNGYYARASYVGSKGNVSGWSLPIQMN